jgi:hypothetical protein
MLTTKKNRQSQRRERNTDREIVPFKKDEQQKQVNSEVKDSKKKKIKNARKKGMKTHTK